MASNCDICRPIRLPPEVFQSIHFLPDPIPGEDGHYQQFSEVYGEAITKQHRPSLQPSSREKKTLPFIASIQHVRNVNVMVQCELCSMWHLYKLNSQAKMTLECELEKISFSCGADLNFLSL